MITSVRFCLLYDPKNAILRRSKFIYFGENCIVATDVVMTLVLVIPAESVM